MKQVSLVNLNAKKPNSHAFPLLMEQDVPGLHWSKALRRITRE
jgi:hypothetical protein